jgi:hypothetical protein
MHHGSRSVSLVWSDSRHVDIAIGDYDFRMSHAPARGDFLVVTLPGIARPLTLEVVGVVHTLQPESHVKEADAIMEAVHHVDVHVVEVPG